MGNLRERCGIVCNDKFYEIENASNSEMEFTCNAEALYRILIKCGGDVKAIVHTHILDCFPSHRDLISMEIWNVTWIIVSNNCIKAFRKLDGSISEVDINSFLPQEVYNLIVKLLH